MFCAFIHAYILKTTIFIVSEPVRRKKRQLLINCKPYRQSRKKNAAARKKADSAAFRVSIILHSFRAHKKTISIVLVYVEKQRYKTVLIHFFLRSNREGKVLLHRQAD
ncbi:MAG: hypothetical protein D3904_15770, partial [Candidatus Electrothrix sp. EH2]|nr:hypothetical protein [Candidatus Electrothrix sp. EH2]